MSWLREKLSRHGHEESEVALKGADTVTSEAPNAAMIDAMSIAEYRRQFENYRRQNKHATKAESSHHLKEYIKKKIDDIVDEACKKRKLDVTTVGVSVMTSTFVPYSGVAVVVASTVTKCLTFALTLGLIPLLNVRSTSDVKAMMSQIQKSVEQASKSGSMAAIETAILETLKRLGLGNWLWAEILKDILVEMIGEGSTDSAWIMTPLFAVPKYKMHRHLIKKMYRIKLGDKAHIVHHTWTELNCVQIEGKTTTVSQMQVDADEDGKVQGAHLQSVAITATDHGAQVTQTDAYIQQPNGGVGQAQVTRTNAYYEQEKGGAPVLKAQTVSTSNAYF